MFTQSVKARALAIAIVAVALAGCATMQVSSYVERGATFPHYQTYMWGPADQLATGDPRLDNNPFFNERIQADVEKQLAGRGFMKVNVAPADLTVHYHASFHDRIDVNGVDREYGYCDAEDCRPYVSEAGTLTIDLVDARTKRLAWRGWAEGTMDGVIDDQAQMERKIHDAVTHIVEGIPK